MCSPLWDHHKLQHAGVPVLHYLPESESEVARLCPTLCDPMDCSLPDSLFHEIFQARILEWVAISFSITISLSLLKLTSIESVMPSNNLIFCYPLLLLPSIFPSIRVFSNELALRIRWPKYWSFSFRISPSNEYSGLISFSSSLVRSPCSPRDSKEPFPTPQFKSINSSVLSFLYGPTLTSIHYY